MSAWIKIRDSTVSFCKTYLKSAILSALATSIVNRFKK